RPTIRVPEDTRRPHGGRTEGTDYRREPPPRKTHKSATHATPRGSSCRAGPGYSLVSSAFGGPAWAVTRLRLRRGGVACSAGASATGVVGAWPLSPAIEVNGALEDGVVAVRSTGSRETGAPALEAARRPAPRLFVVSSSGAVEDA